MKNVSCRTDPFELVSSLLIKGIQLGEVRTGLAEWKG
jgi:hypothetical protein